MLKRTSEDSGDYRGVRDRAVAANRKARRHQLFGLRRNHAALDYQQTHSDSDDEPQLSHPKVLDQALAQHIALLTQTPVSLQDLPALIDCLEHEDTLKILEGVMGIRRILGLRRPPTLEMMEAGVHNRLLQLSAHSCPQVRLESWWALANLAVGDAGECKELQREGAIESFLRSLREEEALVAEQGAWGLANLACDSVALRDAILQQGAIPLLAEALNRFQSARFTQIAAETIATLCMGQSLPAYELVEQGVVLLCCLLDAGCIADQDCLAHLLLAIRGHCKAERRTEQQLQALIETEFPLALIALTTHQHALLVERALAVLQNLLTRTEVVDLLLKLKLLDYLEHCLLHHGPHVRLAALFALANIACGTQGQVAFFLRHHSLLTNLKNLMAEADSELKAEAVRVYAFLGENCGNAEIEAVYRQAEVLEAVVELLRGEEQAQVVQSALQSLFNMLQHAEERGQEDAAVEMLEELHRKGGFPLLLHYQHHTNAHLSYEADKIVSRFISAVPAEDAL